MAVFDFGLSPSEFGQLTPAKFLALSKRLEAAKESEEFGPALLSSVITNALGTKTSPEDYMPSVIMKKARKKAKDTEEAKRHELMKRYCLELASVLGGTITKDG